MIRANTILFATDDSDESIADARAWIKAQGFTADQVKFVKRESQCLIIAKVPVSPKLTS